MKRLHVSLSTDKLAESIAFYSQLFGVAPTVEKDDYAKWMLDDPRVNFSLSTHGQGQGFDHLGIEAETQVEFDELRGKVVVSSNEVFEQPEVTCCYAQSAKAWVRDPNGVAWETFISHKRSDSYGDGSTGRAVVTGADNRSVTAKCCA